MRKPHRCRDHTSHISTSRIPRLESVPNLEITTGWGSGMPLSSNFVSLVVDMYYDIVLDTTTS